MSVVTHAPPSEVVLRADDTAEFEQVTRALGTGEVDDPGWVAQARSGWDLLPLRLRRSLREFRRHSGPRGALLVRGVPVGEPGVTPSALGSVERSATVSAASLVLVACGLGDPAAFKAEKSGALVQNVVPVPGQEEMQGNSGSVLLSFHNENAFHEHRPDFVMLLCLRADPDRVAGLRTVCIREVLPLLSTQTREALFHEEFVTEPPPSFGGSDGATSPHAVLFGAPDDPDMRVDLAATTPLTPRATEALTELGEALAASASVTKLEPGDLAIVDNRVTVHGRTAFRPRYDGTDRWLQRTFVAADVRRSRDHRPGDGYVLIR